MTSVIVHYNFFMSSLIRVKNTAHAFRKIVKEGGVKGLWKGWLPNVQRAALVNLGGLYFIISHDTS